MKLPNLRGNIFALTIVQAGNYLVPFLALPYLTRVLGVPIYGKVVFIQTLMQFGTLLVDFGFGWSATRDIAACRDNSKKVSELFMSIWIFQWILFVILSFVTVVVVTLTSSLRNDLSIYIVGLGIVAGQGLFPIWLLHGIESLKVAATIQVVSKIIALPLLFLWVKGSGDELGAIGYFSISALLAAFISIIWIYYNKVIHWIWPKWSAVYLVMIEGAWIFASRISISIYTVAVPLALGILAGPTELAYFNLADKIRTSIASLLVPVSQALLPRMSYLFQVDRSAAFLLLRKSGWMVGGISLAAGCFVWLFAEQIMTILGGSNFVYGIKILHWLAFVPFFIGGSNLLGVQVMIPLGMNRQFALSLFLSSVISLVGLYPIILYAGGVGAAQLVFFVECIVTLSMAGFLWRYFKFERIND